MNKVAEQAKFVQEALRAGKKVAIAVPRQEIFERVVRKMIPDDLEIAARPSRHHFKFTNGAMLSFIPVVMRNAGRGVQLDLVLHYLYDPSARVHDIERWEEVLQHLRRPNTEFQTLELPE